MNKIKPFEVNSNRTLLSAKAANELVKALNSFITMAGAKDSGITVKVSESGAVIDVDPAKLAERINDEGGVNGSNFQGDWDSGSAYSLNDIVIRETTGDINDGTRAGTYIALQDMDVATNAANPPGEAGSEAYWDTFSRGNWGKLVLRFAGSDKAITIDTDPASVYPKILIEHVEGDTNEPRCEIDLAALTGTNKFAKFRETDICVSGVWKKTMVLRTDAYT